MKKLSVAALLVGLSVLTGCSTLKWGNQKPLKPSNAVKVMEDGTVVDLNAPVKTAVKEAWKDPEADWTKEDFIMARKAGSEAKGKVLDVASAEKNFLKIDVDQDGIATAAEREEYHAVRIAKKTEKDALRKEKQAQKEQMAKEKKGKKGGKKGKKGKKAAAAAE